MGRMCVCVRAKHLQRCKTSNRHYEFYFQQGATAPLISPWPTKLLMFGEDMQSDQLHVPALFHFHFIVNGNRLSQEPACRFFGGFLVLLHCCRNLHVSFDNRRVSFNLISSSTGYGDRNFGYFLGSFHRPTPVRYNWSVFARKMHSTSEFAKIVRSKCVIHAGFVIVS